LSSFIFTCCRANSRINRKTIRIPVLSQNTELMSLTLQIILSQEKNIHRLNELVRSLKQQLLQCKCTNEPRTGPSGTLTERIIELERQQILED